ncbi:MAG: hypothetical protein ACF8MJ_01055 [Phycisphaerales bacterium JB050]
MPEKLRADLVSTDPEMTIVPLADGFRIGTTDTGEEIHHAAYTAALAASQSVYETAGKLAEADEAIRSLGKQPDAATGARLRKNARAAMDRAQKTYADTLAKLAEHSDSLSAEAEGLIGTETARLDINSNARGAEVRSLLRTMPKHDREALIESAIADGDQEVVAGVLAASPLLSGIDRKRHAMLREQARVRFAPEQDRLIKGIDRLANAMRTANGALEKRFGSITGAGDSRQARAERSLAALEGGVS